MKDFLLLFRGGLQFQTASPDEIQQHMLVWKDWMDQLSKEGRVTGGERLTGEGATIRGEQRQVTDGPFAEGKEVLGGYFSIKAHNLQDAKDRRSINADAKLLPIFGKAQVTMFEIAKVLSKHLS